MSVVMTREGAKCWWKEDLPPEIAYLHKDWSGQPWIQVTYKELREKKKEKQDHHIWMKRHGSLNKPCFIWVFYNSGWLFGGWYIYIRTLKKDFALNFRQHYPELVNQIMALLPCGVIPFDFETWAEAFERTYHHPAFGRKKQGLFKAWCKIDERGDVVNISFKNIYDNKNL